MAVWKSQLFPNLHFFADLFLAQHLGVFSAALLLDLGQRSRVFEQSGVYYKTCLSMSSLSALLRSCRSNLFAKAIHTEIVQTRLLKTWGKAFKLKNLCFVSIYIPPELTPVRILPLNFRTKYLQCFPTNQACLPD